MDWTSPSRKIPEVCIASPLPTTMISRSPESHNGRDSPDTTPRDVAVELVENVLGTAVARIASAVRDPSNAHGRMAHAERN